MKHVRTFILIGIVYFFSGLTLSHSYAHQVIEIEERFKSVELSEIGYYYYRDPSKALDISMIKSIKDCFLLKKDNKSFSPQNESVWTHFNLKYIGLQAEKKLILELAHAHIEEYKVFIYEDNKLIKYDNQGDSFPFYKREISHNFFIHTITLLPNKTYSVYFKIDQYGQEIPFPLHIYSEGAFSRENIVSKLFHGLIIGLCLITSLVTLILYIIFKHRFYIIEVLVSLFSILYILAEEGYGFMYIWSSSPYFNGVSRPLFVGCVIVFGLWFTIEFLDSKKRTPRSYRVALIIAFLYSCYLLLVHPFNMLSIRTFDNVGYIVSIFMVLTLLSGAMILWISFQSWWKKKNADGIVIFGVFLITIILAFIRLLGIQGIIPHTELIQHTGFITRALHIPIIGLYLVYHALDIINHTKNVQIELLQAKANSNNQLIQGINDERRRVAMAIHDSAGGLITGLKANYDVINREHPNVTQNKYYQNGLSIISKLNQELRTISNNLYPSTLQKLGLVEELKKLLHEIRELHNIDTHIEIHKEETESIDKDIQLQLYYILHEILDNAVVHAQAKNIWIQYNNFSDEINIVVEDDGHGFDYNKALNKDRNGLKNLNHRIRVLDGSIDYFSKPDQGTSISINIPTSVA